MLLVSHITLAIATLLVSTFTLFDPSMRKINFTYFLTFATLFSAGALVIVDNASLGHTCLTAFAYLAIVSISVYISKRRLAQEESEE